ncbi:hypothetical protein PN498_21930 [Oscillatoria sp. CS-180]|uniref:hypothetical protein n=1 Tax=Oscillatoria sp. CS-180 TaxID=3021720 RepID=UPI00232DB06E|nr:hypothetical protein [Oscillatoria sp. CS-180]MDB9528667.1 hypothetical protein [Oscillatoria sp. CS-180]
MTSLQKLGGIAAFLNAIVAIATLAIVVFLIRLSAIADPTKLNELAIHNPLPLLVQDGLKLFSAALSTVLVLALASYLRRHDSANNSATLVASSLGILSALCLAGNAAVSLYGITQATTLDDLTEFNGDQLNNWIRFLALAAIGLDGLWLFWISWLALKHRRLPVYLCYFGLVMGMFSLIPPLGLIVLILGIFWSIWIGNVLLQDALTNEI